MYLSKEDKKMIKAMLIAEINDEFDEEEEPEPKEIDCPDCEGHGQVWAGEGDNEYAVTCPKCDGDGVIIED